MAQRAFPNPYADYNKSLAEGYFDAAGRLTPEFSQRLTNKIRELLHQMERGLKSADPRDGTGYTGWAGGRVGKNSKIQCLKQREGGFILRK
uniref:LanC like glutathione S-transferase 1 n=1 Tax=Prolemur simus TaxID=1328070 RepID=A0A8C9DQ88_PROSS